MLALVLLPDAFAQLAHDLLPGCPDHALRAVLSTWEFLSRQPSCSHVLGSGSLRALLLQSVTCFQVGALLTFGVSCVSLPVDSHSCSARFPPDLRLLIPRSALCNTLPEEPLFWLRGYDSSVCYLPFEPTHRLSSLHALLTPAASRWRLSIEVPHTPSLWAFHMPLFWSFLTCPPFLCTSPLSTAWRRLILSSIDCSLSPERCIHFYCVIASIKTFPSSAHFLCCFTLPRLLYAR